MFPYLELNIRTCIDLFVNLFVNFAVLYKHHSSLSLQIGTTIFSPTNVQCTNYNVSCTLYTAHCIMYNIQYTMYNLQYLLCSVQHSLYTVLCTVMYSAAAVYSAPAPCQKISEHKLDRIKSRYGTLCQGDRRICMIARQKEYLNLCLRIADIHCVLCIF